jgi:uncharacterized protein
MRSTFRCIAVLILSLSAAPRASHAQATGPVALPVPGIWEGALEPGPVRLRLSLEIRRSSTGSLESVLTSLDQGNSRIPGTVLTSADSIRIDMAGGAIVFRARIAAMGDSLVGQWFQGPSPLPLVLARVQRATDTSKPQDPRPPFPYASSDVTVEASPGVSLAGTLMIPQGPGPFPAAIIISGSGAHDRDGAMLGHRPYLVLGDYLARQGIAVFRYDERGVGKSTGNFAAATSADFADDAQAALQWLRRHPSVDQSRVGFIGHSEGGLVAPLVASRIPADVGFLVLMAGPGVTGAEVLALQGLKLAMAAGVPRDVAEGSVALNRRVYAAVNAGGDSAAIMSRVRQIMAEHVATLPPEQRAAAAAVAPAMDAEMAVLTRPWHRYFLAYDPATALRGVRAPVLALNGSLDLQVDATQNLPAIAAALRAGGNRQVTTVTLEGVNHLFQNATTGTVAEYSTLQETISPTVLDLIARWILELRRR